MPPSPGNTHTLATDIGEIRPGADLPRDRLRLLLKEFAALDDAREPWRVLYPLHEVLLLVTCATIASCDDFDDIVAWGTHHLAVLRRFSPLPPRHSQRALAARPRQPRRPAPVRPLLRELDRRAVARPARPHRP